MNIPARELHPDDVLHEHDWSLHVVRVDRETGGGVAVLVVEFEFLLHRRPDETVQVDRPMDALPGVVSSPPVTALGGVA